MLQFRADLLLETLAMLAGIEFPLHFVQAIQCNREFLLHVIDGGGAARIAGGTLLSNGGQRQSQQGYGNEQETFPEPAGIPLQMALGWLRHTSLLNVKMTIRSDGSNSPRECFQHGLQPD